MAYDPFCDDSLLDVFQRSNPLSEWYQDTRIGTKLPNESPCPEDSIENTVVIGAGILIVIIIAMITVKLLKKRRKQL